LNLINWKRGLLTGGLALFLLSGSSIVSAMGRNADPIDLQPLLSPLSFQSEYLAKWKSEYSALQTIPLQPAFFDEDFFPAPGSVTGQNLPVVPLLAAAAAVPQMTPAAAKEQQPEARQKTESQPKAVAAAAPKANKSVPAQTKAKPVEKSGAIVTVTGATITPKKTIAAKASAYTGSAEENGGYAGKDYFGNPLQVGTIAVDPDTIPLGSTVYVTGYSYDGLPVGGMMAKAVDIGGAINGNRIDIYVPGSREKAKKFGYQNVTLHVVD
jgi:3D (Asp-Asp-Asp) domain-containing protein